MEALEELQKILDDAPVEATHVDSDNAYIKWVKTEGLHFNYGNKWSDWEVMEIQDIEVMRSLADIQRIVDLMKLTRGFSKSLDKIATHIQKSQPSFCMGGVDSDDEFSSASKIVEYIEKLEGK